MQQVAYRPTPPSQPPNMNGNGRGASQGIVIAALTLFAFSGLLIGFAVGALTHKHTTTASLGPKPDKTSIISQATATPTPAVDVATIGLGCPIIDQDASPEVANGTITYTFVIHAVDKSGGCGHGNPVNAPGITCRLWLLKASDDPLHGVPDDRRTNMNTLANPFPEEVVGGLIFDPTTKQTQNCDDQGRMTWKYQVAPSVDEGRYDLVVLTDWKGQRYNWSWGYVQITK